MIADDLVTLVNFTVWLKYTSSSIFFVRILSKFRCLGFKQPHSYICSHTLLQPFDRNIPVKLRSFLRGDF